MVDLTLALAMAIITASAVIIGAFLARYRQLLKEAESSTLLAKDIWDSASARFSVLDTRIIDLMAKTEVLATRLAPQTVESQLTSPPTSQPSQPSSRSTSQSPPFSPRSPLAENLTPVVTTPAKYIAAAPAAIRRTVETKTETQVLGLLARGAMSSADIKIALNMSREHVARIMKGLFDRGLVVRNASNKPYVYEITDAGRSHAAS